MAFVSIDELLKSMNDEQLNILLLHAVQTVCSYCLKANEPFEKYSSHCFQTSTGEISCPKLRTEGCPYCKQDGDDAHLATDCPSSFPNMKSYVCYPKKSYDSDQSLRIWLLNQSYLKNRAAYKSYFRNADDALRANDDNHNIENQKNNQTTLPADFESANDAINDPSNMNVHCDNTSIQRQVLNANYDDSNANKRSPNDSTKIQELSKKEYFTEEYYKKCILPKLQMSQSSRDQISDPPIYNNNSNFCNGGIDMKIGAQHHTRDLYPIIQNSNKTSVSTNGTNVQRKPQNRPPKENMKAGPYFRETSNVDNVHNVISNREYYVQNSNKTSVSTNRNVRRKPQNRPPTARPHFRETSNVDNVNPQVHNVINNREYCAQNQIQHRVGKINKEYQSKTNKYSQRKPYDNKSRNTNLNSNIPNHNAHHYNSNAHHFNSMTPNFNSGTNQNAHHYNPNAQHFNSMTTNFNSSTNYFGANIPQFIPNTHNYNSNAGYHGNYKQVLNNENRRPFMAQSQYENHNFNQTRRHVSSRNNGHSHPNNIHDRKPFQNNTGMKRSRSSSDEHGNNGYNNNAKRPRHNLMHHSYNSYQNY